MSGTSSPAPEVARTTMRSASTLSTTPSRLAITHTPEGSRVVVRTRTRNGRAELSVEDDGPGIPAEQHGAVFERFYRVEGSMASGSGLGLSIARELARLMGGAIRLESRPGRTVVTLDLPAVDAPAKAFSRENSGETVQPAS